MTTKENRGGKREGAGRKKVADPKVTFPDRVRSSQIELIRDFIKKINVKV